MLAPGGSFLFDTVNRTPWSWFTAVFGLERVLRMVPRGTHDWRLFIRPAELDRLLRGAGLAPVELCGLAPRSAPAWSPAGCSPAASTSPASPPARAPSLLWGITEGLGMTARLQALGTAMPDHYVFKQSEIVEEFFARQPGGTRNGPRCSPGRVERRASVVDPSYYARPRSTADRMRSSSRPPASSGPRRPAGPGTGRAGAAAEVGDLLAVSCTGYSGPGLDVHLVDDLGLGDRVQRLAIGHMGCYAALPALRTAAALATASGRRALVTCVELCTLHVQPARTREDAVYQALFGDGAAAALVGPGGGGPPSPGRPR